MSIPHPFQSGGATAAALLLAVFLSCGCASGPKVYAHAAPEFSSAAYRTFGFLQDADTNRQGYSTLLTQYLEAATTDLVDRARNQLVWEGAAVGRVTEQKLKDPQPAIDGAVAAIFARFPLGGPGSAAATQSDRS
jgi:hypothetical protein